MQKSIIKTSYTMELIFHIIVICHPQVYHYLPDKSNLQLIYRKQHKTRTRQERPYEKKFDSSSNISATSVSY